MSPSLDTAPSPETIQYENDWEKEQIRAYADFLAKLLDTAIIIPRTSIRIGLDPLLGLIPGIGDVLANLIGSTLLFLATRLRVPKIVLARMALNIFVNTAIGAIPGIGDMFSIWFKSNIKNAALLRRYSAQGQSPSTIADWGFVIGLICISLGLAVVIIFGFIWIIAQLSKLTF